MRAFYGGIFSLLFHFCIVASDLDCDPETDDCTFTGDDKAVTYVCELNKKLYVSTDACEPVVAKATFENAINTTGWAFLQVETSSSYSNAFQAYAAGLAEGAATQDLMYLQWYNTVSGYCDNSTDYCDRLQTYLNSNLKWLREQIASHPNDSYWDQVMLMLIQLAGLEDGYFEAGTLKPRTNVDPMGLLLFQINGELEDLEAALKRPKHLRKKLLSSGSCSAMIKPLDGNSELLFSHVTWSTYQSMLRIQKQYDFKYTTVSQTNEPIPSQKISLSSYPGVLHSIDDFYITSQNLAVMETTIGNNNDSLWQYIKPDGAVPTWIRVMTANRLATSARKWTKLFSQYNSGAYNNQWMVVDYKNFKPNKALPDSDLFFILEQIPGYIRTMDMTGTLQKQGYWPSYNVPYFPDIFNLSGGWINVEKYGDWFTYDKTPRALIFKRDWQSVTDMDTFMHLMRYNNYKKDNLSACNCTPPYSAENAISARSDLNPANGTYPFASLGHRSHGATDMKATSFKMAQSQQFIAISGPTYDDQPPFQWSKSDFDVTTTPHMGHPDLWKFDPIIRNWNTHTYYQYTQQSDVY